MDTREVLLEGVRLPERVVNWVAGDGLGIEAAKDLALLEPSDFDGCPPMTTIQRRRLFLLCTYLSANPEEELETKESVEDAIRRQNAIRAANADYQRLDSLREVVE